MGHEDGQEAQGSQLPRKKQERHKALSPESTFERHHPPSVRVRESLSCCYACTSAGAMWLAENWTLHTRKVNMVFTSTFPPRQKLLNIFHFKDTCSASNKNTEIKILNNSSLNTSFYFFT